jgi:predicted outer membrane protein
MMGEHGPAAHFAKIMEEVDRNMQQALVRDLSSKQGNEFDRCYLSGQLFGHIWVAEALKTFQRDASPQLKPILQEGLQASEQHLTHIKSLLARLENEPRTNDGLRPRGGLRSRGRSNQ